MATITIKAYLSQLQVREYRDPLRALIKQSLVRSHQADKVEKEFKHVLTCLNHRYRSNESQDHFEATFLKKVVAEFRTDAESQALDLQILDAILVKAQSDFGLTSDKVPAIIKIRRDKPLLQPHSLLMANAAAKIHDVLLREVEQPSTLTSPDQIMGRLLLFLYFFERVEKVAQAMLMLTTAPRLHYAEGIVFIEVEYKSKLCRQVLSEPGALLWMQWLKMQSTLSSPNLQTASYYINLYLSGLSDWHQDTLTLPKLALLRKIDSLLRYSPIQFAFYTGYIQSQLLRSTTFVRLLTDRQVPDGGGKEIVNDDLLTEREKRTWVGLRRQDRYASVDSQLAELKYLLGCLRPPPGKPKTAALTVSRTELNEVFTDWLEQNKDKHSPYLWFLAAWARSLFRQGGRVKRSLKPGTIVDYVSSIGEVFLSVFNSYRLSDLDGIDWVELLNRTTDEVKSSSRKGYVLYFATFLRDAELVPDLPVSELETAVSHGEVDANLLSVTHAEAILGKLLQQQDEIARDAHLLFCFCFYSGLRRSEAAFLQLADLDFAVNEPTENGYDYVDLLIRRNQKRGLKSKAADRELPLDALWPAHHLSLLRMRVHYRRSRGEGPTSLLFDSPERSAKAYRLITDLMHKYTGDRSLRVHHLRHSFANWTWFKLTPELLKVGRAQLGMFQGTFFSDTAITHFYQRLGFQSYSRKGMYVLCHLLGHEEPATTIGSYLHLKDIGGYLALCPRALASKKLLNHTLGRSALVPRCGIGENLAERLTYETRGLEQLISPVRTPAEVNSSLASAKALDSCFVEVNKKKQSLGVLNWAAILMTCRACTAEQVAYEEGLSPAVVRALIDNAAKVQRLCPGQGKRLPLIPALAPWVNQLVTNEKLKHLQIDSSGLTSRSEESSGDAQKSNQRDSGSHSLKVLSYLFSQLQNGLDEGVLAWDRIKDGCQILKYLVPGKGYLIRCPSSRRVIQFLTFCGLLGFKARHIRLKLHLGDMEGAQKSSVLANWEHFLLRTGMKGIQIEIGQPQDCPFLRKHDGYGVMEVRLLNTQLRSEGRRQRVFLSMMQLMLILSLTLSSKNPY